jgi:c-di-GMP-binding flagellar brake protein YcgR
METQSGETAGIAKDETKSPPQERRKARRYALRDARGSLSWTEGSDHVTREMTVIDISGGGAAVLVDRAPAAGQTVWLCLQNSIPGTASLEAHVVATSADPAGKHLIRVRFISWVPLDAILERHQERRSWQRYPARGESRAALYFHDQDVERTIRGELLNISGGGVAVITEVAPPAGTRLFFGLVNEALPTVPIEVKLVVISLDASGSTVVRLSFVDSCPMEVFELATQASTG